MSIQYDNYIYEHCDNVSRGLQWMRDHMGHIADQETWLMAMEDAMKHDESKWSPDEYTQYDRYFYGDRSYQVVQNFDYAWLHHIHHNPHHWQYWILFEDDPKTGMHFRALPMPKKDILHMIADWWAFSWKAEKYDEIFKWYGKHKANMILAAPTQIKVDGYLEELKKALLKEGMMDEHEVVVEIQEPVESAPSDIQIVEEKEDDPVSHSDISEEGNWE